LIGDGVKQAKEAKRMLGVKKQYQESENSSKPEYMFGHLFGGIRFLARNLSKTYCIPLYQPSEWDSNHFKLGERETYNSFPCRTDD